MCCNNMSEDEQFKKKRYPPSLMMQIKDASSTQVQMLKIELRKFPKSILKDEHNDLPEDSTEGYRFHSRRLFESPNFLFTSPIFLWKVIALPNPTRYPLRVKIPTLQPHQPIQSAQMLLAYPNSKLQMIPRTSSTSPNVPAP